MHPTPNNITTKRYLTVEHTAVNTIGNTTTITGQTQKQELSTIENYIQNIKRSFHFIFSEKSQHISISVTESYRD